MRSTSITMLAAAVSLGAWIAPAAAGPDRETTGVIDAVTVYRGQALVTRIIPIDGPAGLQEVVVTDLPRHILPGSIYAESANGLEVRSLRYRERPEQSDVREDVRALDARLLELRDALDANESLRLVLQGQQAYLDKLEAFTGQTATTELAASVLDPAKLKEMTAFLFDQRQALAERRLALQRGARDLGEEIDLLRRRRETITSASSRTAREVVVFVQSSEDAGGKLRLRYLVDQATWSPSYTIRAGHARDDITIEYSASVRQRSGEDWSNVRMTLSTAFPSLTAQAPELTPLTVVLAQIAPQGQFQQDAYASARSSIVRRQRQVAQDRAGSKQSDLTSFDQSLNVLANELQLLELARAIATDGAPPPTPEPTRADEGLSVSYELAGRLSLPSRNDQQLLQIAAAAIDASFHRLASPVLTDYIYEEAEAVNTSGMVLLAGPVASYIGGKFVGNGELPTVASGEPFTVGFGIDSSLRASRELAARTESIQGGNKIIEFTYELLVENFNDRPVPLRLLDRMPATESKEVRVTLVETSVAPSDDAAHARAHREDGILRWDIEVPVGSGAEAFVVSYRFRMEFDKQMTLAGGAAVPAS
jgi:uncharacterized protein (TIGR02231 family)